MAEKGKKDIGKTRVAIVGVGFVLGVLLLVFGAGGGEKTQVKADDAAEYRSVVEKELVALCENMLGEKVDVFVSLESGYGYSYALDSRGGVMTVGSGSSESALVERVRRLRPRAGRQAPAEQREPSGRPRPPRQ